MLFSIIFSISFCLFILKDYLKEKKEIEKSKNKKNIYLKYIISTILVFSCIFIRSYKFTKVPIPINFDEASVGYESYSVLNYKIDRNGNSLPTYFIAWGSGQSTLYSYLSMPFILLFNNTIFSIRLLMLIISSFSCIIMYYLLKDIFKEKYLYAFFIFTIIPWHIMKSRWALDANIFPDIILLILFLYNRYFKNSNIKILYLISILLGISTYSYATSYIFIPIFLLLNLFYLVKNRYINIKHYILLFSITIIISFPMLLFAIINYFNLSEIKISNITIPRLDFNRFDTVTIIKDKNIIFSMLNNLKDNILLLFQTSDDRILNSIKPYYTLYYISIPFIFIGFYYLFKLKKENKIYNIFINNIIASFILMIFVTKSIHRINCIWYVIIIIVLIGLINFLKEKFYLYSVLIIYLLSFIFFINIYFNNYNKKLTILNNNGYYECLIYIKENKLKYDELIISDTMNLPYITYLYVNKINPYYYIKNREIENKNVEFQIVKKIGNVYFEEPKEIKKENVYILTKYRTDFLKISDKNKKCYSDYCVIYFND